MKTDAREDKNAFQKKKKKKRFARMKCSQSPCLLCTLCILSYNRRCCLRVSVVGRRMLF